MSYSNIQLEIEYGIATVTVCRPEALNALNSVTLGELSSVFDLISEDEDIRVLILTGSGEKAFVAGVEISEVSAFTPLQGRAFTQKGQMVISKLQDLAVPGDSCRKRLCPWWWV